MTMPDISEACPALLSAVHEALHCEPCKVNFSCLRSRNPRGNIRDFIRRCWYFIPEHARDNTYLRLKVCQFASANGYLGVSWRQFIENFDECTILHPYIQEQYQVWLESLPKRHSPSKAILRILSAQSLVTLAVATYVLETVGTEAKHNIAALLLAELHRVCHRCTFIMPDLRRPLLKIQFTPACQIEQRPIILLPH